MIEKTIGLHKNILTSVDIAVIINRIDIENFTRLSALTVEMIVKFHSNQQKGDQYIAEIVLENTRNKMICKDCKGTKIRSRTNYSHGKKSGSTTTLSCKLCGSTNIEKINQNRRKNFRK
jgi:Zn finger protein HypA/HybF involved in hydrogenase expression